MNISDDLERVARAERTARHAAEQGQRFSMERIHAALEGRFDSDKLDEAESEIFYDMLGAALAVPNEREREFFQRLNQEGGGVGYDEADNLVRGLPGGGTERIG